MARMGGDPELALDGSYVGNEPRLGPNGSYVGGRPSLAPDGTYVGSGPVGSRFFLSACLWPDFTESFV